MKIKRNISLYRLVWRGQGRGMGIPVDVRATGLGGEVDSTSIG